MLKRNVFFDFGLPVSINILELSSSPICFYQNHVLAILILSGSVEIKKDILKKEYLENDIALIDVDTPVQIKALEKNAFILAININTPYYQRQFPTIENAIFSDIDDASKSKLVPLLLDSAFALAEQNKDSYSIIDDNMKVVLNICLNNCQYFSKII